jgi:hypothetical protein
VPLTAHLTGGTRSAPLTGLRAPRSAALAQLYLQKMARRKRGEEERVVVDTNMGMGNYLRRVLSADFVASSFRRTLTPPKDDSAATRQRMRSTPGSKRAGDKDFSIR